MTSRPYALDRLKVEQIVVTERYCRDTAQWYKLRNFWHPDTEKTSLKITWFKGTIEGHIFGSRAKAKQLMKKPGAGAVKHIITPVDLLSTHPLQGGELLIEVDGDRALCEAYGTINTRTTVTDTDYDLSSSATFLFKFVRLEEEWKIISLECLYDKDNLVPVINPSKEPLTIDYPRESYKCLAYVLSVSGKYKVDPELPGWDRPAEAQKVLLAARAWVAEKPEAELKKEAKDEAKKVKEEVKEEESESRY